MRAHHVPSSKYQALLVHIKYQQQALDESDTRLVLVLGFRWAQMSIEQIQTDVHDVHGGKYNGCPWGQIANIKHAHAILPKAAAAAVRCTHRN